MRFSRFFVDRPIFAAVLSLVIVVAGAIALFQLPISEYPQVVPPTVVVRATYPGANPRVIAETVASPLEQQINGIEDMLYMFSQATSDGRMTLTITFALGTNLDNAQVQVQNRVAQALPRLPSEVQRIGVVTELESLHLLLHDVVRDLEVVLCLAALLQHRLARLERGFELGILSSRLVQGHLRPAAAAWAWHGSPFRRGAQAPVGHRDARGSPLASGPRSGTSRRRSRRRRA